MASVNRAYLIGHCGKDAEVRYTNSGIAVCNFTLATSEKQPDGTERTDWHSIVCWAKQAELAGQYIRKGRQVYVEGRINQRDYITPQGEKRYKTEIVANRFMLLGNKGDMPLQDGYIAPVGYGSANNDSFDVGDLGPPLPGE